MTSEKTRKSIKSVRYFFSSNIFEIFLVLFISFLFNIQGLSASMDINALLEQEKLLSERIQWPGFDPSAIPAMIYLDGNTYLVNHPVPPAEFKKNTEANNIYIYQGKHDLLKANTCIDVTGINTACIDADMKQMEAPAYAAAVLIHEKFHCYQKSQHPDWWEGADELAVFMEYPVDNPKLLKLVFLEMEALQNAQSTQKADERYKWMKKAVDLRTAKYTLMPESCIKYERWMEIIEGTAAYVQGKASNITSSGEQSENILQADNIRMRTYYTGSLICNLLDKTDISWKEKIDPKKGVFLDKLLEKTIPDGVQPNSFDPIFESKIKPKAQKSVNDYLMRKLEVMDGFLKKPGFKIVIDFGARPLWPAGFDPMNMEKISRIELLHKRWIKLAGDRAEVEILGIESMTEGKNNHPLYSGVKQIVIPGLKTKPEIIQQGGKISIKTENITANIEQAEIETRENITFIRLI